MNVAGFGQRMLHSSLALLSVVGAIGRAGLRKEVGLLRPEPRGPKVLWHQMVQWGAGGTEYPRWWHRQWGRQQFCWFFELDTICVPCSVLPWQGDLSSVSDKFKIIITLCRAQKNGYTWSYKNFIFLYSPLLHELFCNFSWNHVTNWSL